MTDRETLEISQEDIEKAKERLTMAMGALSGDSVDVGLHLHLQHAHAALGGEKEELYREFEEAQDE